MCRLLINLISGVGFLVFCYCVYLYENEQLSKTLFGFILFVIIGIVGLMSVFAKKLAQRMIVNICTKIISKQV